MRSDVVVMGGGLAGIAAAAALAEKGRAVTLVERHSFLGGRAAAYPYDGGWLDNCQHVILGCCVNLLDLLDRLKTRKLITFHEAIPFVANGKTTVFRPSFFPEPLHFFPGFLKARLFSTLEKLSAFRLFSDLLFSPDKEADLEKLTMLEWLKSKGQPDGIVENFWKIILVSCVNESLDRMSAKYGVMVLRTAFLPSREAALMGTPNVSLAGLYHESASTLFDALRVRLVRGKVNAIAFDGGRPSVSLEDGSKLEADDLVSALPYYNLLPVLPPRVAEDPFFSRFSRLETSPILGIHLWFDREITRKPFGAMPGSPIHWFFVKPPERNRQYVQLVVSACREFMKRGNAELIGLGLSELARYLPSAAQARLLKSHVVREARATFSALPGSDALRPHARTPIPHFYLAGDWTDTGWPATMEGATRSGYRCAELVLAACGNPVRLVKNDLRASGWGSRLPGLAKKNR